MPPNTVYVGRPTKWGNPFSVKAVGMTGYAAYWGEYKRSDIFKSHRQATEECVRLYGEWLGEGLALDDPDLPGMLWLRCLDIEELRGKDLMCWCAEGQPCHALVLLELANKGEG